MRLYKVCGPSCVLRCLLKEQLCGGQYRPAIQALLKQEWVGWALIDQRLAAANNRYGAKHATKLVLSERTYGYEEAE